MKKIFFLMVFLIYFFSANVFGQSDKTGWVIYDETICSDAWGDCTISEIQKKENILKYFEGKGIQISKLIITGDGTSELCKSCGCKSGNRIHCEVKKGDLSKMLEQKFVIK